MSLMMDLWSLRELHFDIKEVRVLNLFSLSPGPEINDGRSSVRINIIARRVSFEKNSFKGIGSWCDLKFSTKIYLIFVDNIQGDLLLAQGDASVFFLTLSIFLNVDFFKSGLRHK